MDVTQMRAIVCDGVGEANVMHMATVDVPAPFLNGAPQVLIRVKAAGINRPEFVTARGFIRATCGCLALVGFGSGG